MSQQLQDTINNCLDLLNRYGSARAGYTFVDVVGVAKIIKTGDEISIRRAEAKKINLNVVTGLDGVYDDALDLDEINALIEQMTARIEAIRRRLGLQDALCLS